jgi:hypothetical protein
MDRHHFRKLDPDPNPHQSGMLYPDPHPHQSEIPLEGYFEALEVGCAAHFRLKRK